MFIGDGFYVFVNLVDQHRVYAVRDSQEGKRHFHLGQTEPGSIKETCKGQGVNDAFVL